MRHQFLRALTLTIAIFSSLLWLYVAGSAIFAGVDVHYPFLDSVPGISISAVGVASFVLAFAATLIYLTFWGWKGKGE